MAARELASLAVALGLFGASELHAKPPAPAPPPVVIAARRHSVTTVAQLVEAVREKAKGLEGSEGTRRSFQDFTLSFALRPESVRLADYAVIRLLFEATRDAGLWNLRWSITDLPPQSDNIWHQWQQAHVLSPAAPTATAECDELSALFAFLVRSAGVRGVGLLWPAENHTVATWIPNPGPGKLRVVVPTTQIFLSERDRLGTRSFDPWKQKTIYEYTRRDVPNAYELPTSLTDFFLRQMDRFGGATDATLQSIRYLREAVFQKRVAREQAARTALDKMHRLGTGPPEDRSAWASFVEDLLPDPPVGSKPRASTPLR